MFFWLCGPLFLSTLSLRRATRGTQLFTPSIQYFYPRSPCGERRCRNDLILTWNKFLSTLSLRRATTGAFYEIVEDNNISIHALLAESDPFLRSGRMTRPYFYPRSPCGERLLPCFSRSFLSNFYPRSPCGERPHANRYYVGLHLISIHALLAESDLTICNGISPTL